MTDNRLFKIDDLLYGLLMSALAVLLIVGAIASGIDADRTSDPAPLAAQPARHAVLIGQRQASRPHVDSAPVDTRVG